jgi:hypothetical protein
MLKRSKRETEPLPISIGELKIATLVMGDIKKGTYAVRQSRREQFVDKLRAEQMRREGEKVLTPLAVEGELPATFGIHLEISSNTRDFMHAACVEAIEYYGVNTRPEVQESLNVLRGLTSALAR